MNETQMQDTIDLMNENTKLKGDIALLVKHKEELIHGANDLQIALKKVKAERDRLLKLIEELPHTRWCPSNVSGLDPGGPCNCPKSKVD